MKTVDGFEAVIGLEVHVELKTRTKMFCSCKTDFGMPPNTQICPVCTGLPGSMPMMNKKAVELAVRAGIGTNCKIANTSVMARKNYFYPDLPKAYQISQYDMPLCTNGYLDIETGSGAKRIGITRIHIEEDAGKLLHSESGETLIDFNRCGVPLIEIVSEPDIRSAEEARAYLQKLRSIMLYAGVSDCRMNEGSLRCDVNLSVRRVGESAMGTRTEMKNLNSFQFIAKAIEGEYLRQVEVIQSGGTVVQETRRYDEKLQRSFSMRHKETSADYRFFSDPDLMPVVLTNGYIDKVRCELPQMPDDRIKTYTDKYCLSSDDADILTADKTTADYFESCAEKTGYPKICAGFILSEIMGIKTPEEGIDRISPLHIAELANLTGDGEINSATAKKLIREMWQGDFDPVERVDKDGLRQIRDAGVIKSWVAEAVSENPKSVADFQKGKASASKAIIGKAMAKSGGRADPRILSDMVMQELKKLQL